MRKLLIAMIVFVVVKQSVIPRFEAKQDRPHYPGKPLTEAVNRQWTERYGMPLPIAYRLEGQNTSAASP